MLHAYMAIASYSYNYFINYRIANTILVDMMEHCIMCGAGHASLNHPDYSDQISSYNLKIL